MDDATIRRRVDEFIQALHRVEREGEVAVAGLVRLFAPDARIANAITKRVQQDRQGREAIRHFWADYAAALRGGESRFSHVTVGDNAAGLFWTTTSGGRAYDGATLLEFDDDGAITSLRGYFDPDELRGQRQAA